MPAKKRILLFTALFSLVLGLDLLLRALDMPPPKETVRYPTVNLTRFFELLDQKQIGVVRVYRYAANPALVSLTAQWQPRPGRTVTLVSSGSPTESQADQIRALHAQETFLSGQKTIEETLSGDVVRPNSGVLSVLINMLDLILMVAGIVVVFMGMTAMLGQGQSGNFRAKLKPVRGSKVRLADVAGCDEAKEEVAEVVEFLRDPARFTEGGGTIPKGVLLIGPPGTGKTMLAKAIANEADANFLSVDGSQFVEMFVGVGSSRVRSLFEEARRNSPCLIFIDEIDSLAGRRDDSAVGNSERNQTVNSLLVEMDGFSANSGVIVIAATNRPEMLDSAVLRPGRFDRKVHLGLPDLEGRRQILDVHLRLKRNLKLAEDVDLRKLAGDTAGFSGADLANLLNEAALHAARGRRKVTTLADLDTARDKVVWGRERNRFLTPGDRKVIAYHEAGHAVLHVLCPQEGMRLQKVTIIPRGDSLGAAHFSPERDIVNRTYDQLLAEVRCLMGGRIAEEQVLGRITSGACGDIREATRRLRSMVLEWGMAGSPFVAYADGNRALCSPETLARAEQQVEELARREYAEAQRILVENRAALDIIAGELLERETLSGDDIIHICRTRTKPVYQTAAPRLRTKESAPGEKSPAEPTLPGVPAAASC